MVGRELTGKYPPRDKPIGKEILRVEGLAETASGISALRCTRGKLLGFRGLLGCGRTETMQLLYGSRKESGARSFWRQRGRSQNTGYAVRSGIGLIPRTEAAWSIPGDDDQNWNTASAVLKRKLIRYGHYRRHKKEKQLAIEY